MFHHVVILTVFFCAAATAPIQVEESSDVSSRMLNITNYFINTPGIGRHKLHLVEKSWEDARVTCLNEGAHLVVIRSAKEEELLLKIMAEHQIVNKDVWLGVHEQLNKDDWISVFNERIDAIGYFNWREGEPNNLGGVEHCIAISVLKFNDAQCSIPRPFFCKIDAT